MKKPIELKLGGVAVDVQTFRDLNRVMDAIDLARAEAVAPLNATIDRLLAVEARENERIAAGLYDGTGQATAENAGAVAGRDEALRKLATANETIRALEEQIKNLLVRRSRKKGRRRG